jgi:protein subunit release factor B
MLEPKKPLFSVTARDCEWSYTRGSGNGGQKKNKTSSAVHCMHRPSGAHGYSEASRSQADNRRDAFTKMSESQEFQKWLHIEFMKRSGEMDEVDRRVEQELTKVKLEVKIDGKWTEVTVDQLDQDIES